MSHNQKPSYGVSEAVQTLFTYRSRNVRASQEVLEKGLFVLEHGGGEVKVAKTMGDEYWAFLEQLAFAAMDLGRLDVADDCIAQLEERFPEAPRVTILHGMRRESVGTKTALQGALSIYNKMLEVDESNIGVWKRRIAVYKQLGEVQKSVDDLCKFLDTFYTDVEGWLELADLYAGNNRYDLSLQALSHALVLSPQNPFYVLQFAETAVTEGDVPTGLKMYLRCLEMLDDEPGVTQEGKAITESKPPPTGKIAGKGIERRAWFGVKLCTRKLLSAESKDTLSDEDTKAPSEDELKALDEVASERLAGVYSGSSEVLAWLGKS